MAERTGPRRPTVVRDPRLRGAETRPQPAMARLLRASCLLSLLLAGLVPPGRGQEKSKTDCHADVSGTIYEYGALTLNGEEFIPFKQYAGKYMLFVNVASY